MAPNLGGQLVTSLFHPSDFSETSRNAFAHALALALAGETELTIFHVSDAPGAAGGWKKFPAVRKTLQDWGMLGEDSPASAVFEKLNNGSAAARRNRRRPLTDFQFHHCGDRLRPEITLRRLDGQRGVGNGHDLVVAEFGRDLLKALAYRKSPLRFTGPHLCVGPGAREPDTADTHARRRNKAVAIHREPVTQLFRSRRPVRRGDHFVDHARRECLANRRVGAQQAELARAHHQQLLIDEIISRARARLRVIRKAETLERGIDFGLTENTVADNRDGAGKRNRSDGFDESRERRQQSGENSGEQTGLRSGREGTVTQGDAPAGRGEDPRPPYTRPFARPTEPSPFGSS